MPRDKNMRRLDQTITMIILTLALAGCSSLNSKFGVDSTNYSEVKELPPLKMPAGSLALSKRYDIPAVSTSNHGKIIENVVPPDYEKE
jgi:uncharacterized lipoprotein